MRPFLGQKAPFCHRSLTRQPAEVPGRNRTSETSLRRPTPKPCHHGLSLPVPNDRFVTALFWGRKVRKRLGKAKSEIRPRSIPKSDWGLVRAWQSCVGHRIAASILRWQQDCPSHSCATHRIALMHYQQNSCSKERRSPGCGREDPSRSRGFNSCSKELGAGVLILALRRGAHRVGGWKIRLSAMISLGSRKKKEFPRTTRLRK